MSRLIAHPFRIMSEPMTPRATVVAVNEPGATLSRVSTALQDEAYEVLLASSGRDVSDLLASRAVDCLILPFESTNLLARERAAASGIPLLVTVAQGNDALVAQVLDAGADDCVPLSDDFGVLKARVRALLRRKRLDDERHAAVRVGAARKE